jgi:hypothetical protein
MHYLPSDFEKIWMHPIHLAVEEAQPEIVELLLANGVDP